jgi:hypothetical protein
LAGDRQARPRFDADRRGVLGVLADPERSECCSRPTFVPQMSTGIPRTERPQSPAVHEQLDASRCPRTLVPQWQPLGRPRRSYRGAECHERAIDIQPQGIRSGHISARATFQVGSVSEFATGLGGTVRCRSTRFSARCRQRLGVEHAEVISHRLWARLLGLQVRPVRRECSGCS